MKCPDCLDSYHSAPRIIPFTKDKDGNWAISSEICSTCKRAIVKLIRGTFAAPNKQWVVIQCTEGRTVRPKTTNKLPAPTEVPESFAADYKEACR